MELTLGQKTAAKDCQFRLNIKLYHFIIVKVKNIRVHLLINYVKLFSLLLVTKREG